MGRIASTRRYYVNGVALVYQNTPRPENGFPARSNKGKGGNPSPTPKPRQIGSK